MLSLHIYTYIYVVYLVLRYTCLWVKSGYIPRNPRDTGFILLRGLYVSSDKKACELLWCTSSIELPSTFTWPGTSALIMMTDIMGKAFRPKLENLAWL